MIFDQERATDSPSTTIIAHNFSLSFEIGTSNISALIQNDPSQSKQEGGQANRPQSDNRNGMLQDKCHVSNCNTVWVT